MAQPVNKRALGSLLVEFKRRLPGSLVLGESFTPRHLERAELEVAERFGAFTAKTPTPFDLEETLQLVSQAWHDGAELGHLPRKHKNRIPWVLFYPSNKQNQWLGADPDFMNSFWKSLIDKNGTVRQKKAILQVFLLHYPRPAPTFPVLCGKLKQILKNTERLSTWREKHQKYSLVDETSPSKFAMRFIGDDDSLEEFLKAAGLTDALAQGGFVKAVVAELLEILQQGLTRGSIDRTTLARLLDGFLLPGRKGLRWGEFKSVIPDTLLLPFVKASPERNIQDALQKFLLQHWGHPKISSANWAGVNARAKDVIQRWLVGVTLREFFALLKKVAAKDRTADDHWVYRQAFWQVFLDKGLISDAWVVLGPVAVQDAKSAFSRSALAFATFSSGSGVAPNQSVLLMKVAGLTVAEWSNNGKCRIWLSDNEKAPKLNEPHYYAERLRRGQDDAVAHHGSSFGTWQATLSSIIQRHTGVELDSDDLMP